MSVTAIIIIGYLVGCVATLGFIGGIRDEMEGIGDMFRVFFWPVIAPCWLAYKLLKAIYNAGANLKTWMNKWKK